ncbi:MAG TPA: hypothetical protein VKB16_11775 [Beijerinckiaceae bacterium]|nr:hypothetical protein [Beijerinckiaceae bacterium]
MIDPAGFIAAVEPRGGIANADGSVPADHARVLDGSHGNPSMAEPPFHEAKAALPLCLSMIFSENR